MKILVVIPAYNEEKIIESTVNKVIKFMKKNIKDPWHLMIAENGSIDKTIPILKKLTKKYPKEIFSFKSIEVRSRSDAIMKAWFSKKADIYIFMDADLSTDIKHMFKLIKGIKQGYDIVIGSRNLKESEVERSIKRNLISFAFNILRRMMFSMKIKDTQCGFKAINKEILENIIKKTKYTSEGFMDTEMLILASHEKYKIKEIPVKWKDDRKSKFNLLLASIKIVYNMIKIKKDMLFGRYNLVNLYTSL